MAPFVAARAAWLAAPVCTGLLVAGIAPLARRVARGTYGGRPSAIRASGLAAGVTTMLASTVLINGGSRFPHILVRPASQG